MSKNEINKTKVAIIIVIAASILIAIYMLMGDSRPKIDIPTSNGNIHIERKAN
ncbi:MAG: hypothetical protein HY063_00985 [Bacteroidetes bacterium]|nr:hypothetical protein [Bacteroidota bacterium]